MSQTFVFVLNGRLYGVGTADYMAELFNDIVVTQQLYGKPNVNISIESADSFTQSGRTIHDDDEIAVGDTIQITCVNGCNIDPVIRTIIHIDYQSDVMYVNTPISYVTHSGKARTATLVEHPNWMYFDSWTKI